MSTQVAIISQTVPLSFCPIKDSDWQQLVALLSGTFTGDPNFNTGSTTPTPTNRGKPWYRTNSDGTPDKWYIFSMGAWLSLHPVTTGLISLFTGNEADIDTLDGGEAGAITSISGPMWQKVAALNARFPLGAGTLPSGALVNPLDTGGEETHVQTVAEMAKHTHRLEDLGQVTSVVGPVNRFGGKVIDHTSPGYGSPTAPLAEDTGASAAMNKMPPYCGVLFIVRTARRFYRINA